MRDTLDMADELIQQSNWSPACNCPVSIIGPINSNGKVRQ